MNVREEGGVRFGSVGFGCIAGHRFKRLRRPGAPLRAGRLFLRAAPASLPTIPGPRLGSGIFMAPAWSPEGGGLLAVCAQKWGAGSPAGGSVQLSSFPGCFSHSLSDQELPTHIPISNGKAHPSQEVGVHSAFEQMPV